MKSILVLCTCLVAFAAVGQQNKAAHEDAIKKAINAYAASGDAQDLAGLTNVLHDAYRLIWYDGAKAPFILDKSGFVAQFEKKEWGGDSRKMQFDQILVFDEINATAKVIMDGKAAEMRSLFSLIKVEGEWFIISELVNATFK